MPKPKGWRTTSRRFRVLRSAFRAEGEAAQAPCWICRTAIDYSVPRLDPFTGRLNDESWELDHLYPQSTHPELAEDPANFRHAHAKCNNVRSNDSPRLSIQRPSRRWVT